MTKENIKEQVMGSMPVKTAGSGNMRGSGVKTRLNPGKVTPQSQIKKIDPQQFDNRSAAVTTNTPSGGSLKAGSFGISTAGQQQAKLNRAEFNKPQPAATSNTSSNTSSSSMSTRDKFKSKFIKKDKGVGFVKRGTPGAQRAENIEKNRMRAKQMAKDNIARKQEAEVKSKSQSNSGGSQTMTASYTPDMDAYDMVLEYLMSTEQAATIEEANYVMTEMDAETIQGIVEEQEKNLNEVRLGTVAKVVVPAAAGLGLLGQLGKKDPVGNARQDFQMNYKLKKLGGTGDSPEFRNSLGIPLDYKITDEQKKKYNIK